jgi:ATP-dependent exoDNAse (exonuclease V) beta subunit
MDYLSNQHPHQNDSHISFEEGPHIYTIDGDSSYTSVTTFNHQHFEPFNADIIIKNMMRSKNWTKSKYYGQTPKEIKAGWEENRIAAATAGTNMHYDIECFYNNIEVSNSSTEYSYFKAFVKQNPHLNPYRTEWMIYDKELQLAGSIDMIFENEDGTLSIYDWKRCKEIKKSSPWNKFSKTECIEHIPDTNYWHYCLQLNTYKAILEKNYNKEIKEMYLICLHPENKNKSFQRIKVVPLPKEIESLFYLRTELLK